MSTPEKPRLLLCRTASCNRCELAVAELNAAVTRADVCVDLALVNGPVESEEQVETVRLTRATSIRLVAFGDCSQGGSLASAVQVDHIVPGCPPTRGQLWSLLDLAVRGGPFSVCHECGRPRTGANIPAIRLHDQIEPERGSCLLDQGIVCMGPATGAGCGAICPGNNSACVGCNGTPRNAAAEGTRMMASLARALKLGYAPISNHSY